MANFGSGSNGSNGAVKDIPAKQATPDLAAILAQMAEMKGALEKLEAENETLKKSGGRSHNVIALKIGEKGGIVLSGLGSRWPVTLYAAQWEALMTYLQADAKNPLAAFIVANEAYLDRKA